MSNLDMARQAAEAARDRRAHLTARALLGGLQSASAWVARVSFRLREGLDAQGGACGASLPRG